MLKSRLLFISDGDETQHYSVVMNIDSLLTHMQAVVEHTRNCQSGMQDVLYEQGVKSGIALKFFSRCSCGWVKRFWSSKMTGETPHVS